ACSSALDEGAGFVTRPLIKRISLVQALPAYAPTSIPSSTTSNSGFVQVIGSSSRGNRGRPLQALRIPTCRSHATRLPHASTPQHPRGARFHPHLGQMTQPT